MTEKFRQGAWVIWKWGAGDAEGQVCEAFIRRVERTINGSRIVRNGDEENPAYLIRQKDGDEVLKSHSELRKR